jgi:hypothetical protein
MKINFISNTEFYLVEDFGTEYKFVLNDKGVVESIIGKSGENEKVIKRVSK